MNPKPTARNSIQVSCKDGRDPINCWVITYCPPGHQQEIGVRRGSKYWIQPPDIGCWHMSQWFHCWANKTLPTDEISPWAYGKCSLALSLVLLSLWCICLISAIIVSPHILIMDFYLYGFFLFKIIYIILICCFLFDYSEQCDSLIRHGKGSCNFL